LIEIGRGNSPYTQRVAHNAKAVKEKKGKYGDRERRQRPEE
jgi:hypothetical protein